jgi:glutathione synthase/RimK-type ligase-like ATP-grasp enzyme
MKTIRADVALLTDRRYTAAEAEEGDWYFGNMLKDDALLQRALERRNLTSVRLDWSDPEVDWSQFQAIVFRTTWDYFERIDLFTDWLKRVEKQTRVINDPSIIWWNMDKHYLRDLQERGVPVVESVFIEKGEELDLPGLLDAAGWEEAVIKPCISGSAWHTYRVNRESAADVQQTVQPLLEKHAFMLQPFLKDVAETGEDTVMVIGGKETHAVRKVAKPGDFRVQDDHGGTVHDHHPSPEQVALAEKAIAACSPAPAYGRVDMVRNNDGEWVVMELELIEPELWLRHHPPAAEQMADAIEKRLHPEVHSSGK